MDELISTGQSDVVGRLAFKYMPCESRAPEDRTACEKLQRLSGQNYQQCLDPYDGSSEDSSSSSNKGPKHRHSRCRMKGRGSRSAVNPPCARRETKEGGTQQNNTEVHHGDIQMRSSSDSELETGFCFPCRAVTRLKIELSDSGFNTRSSLTSPAVPSGTEITDTSSKRIQLRSSKLSPRSPDSPSFHGAFSKRKFFPPSGDGDEGMQRKRPCISDMELENVTEGMTV